MEYNFFTPPVAEGVVPCLAAAGCECIWRILRVQVLLAEVDVLQRVLATGSATRFANGVGG
jgi:hypothetical protein